MSNLVNGAVLVRIAVDHMKPTKHRQKLLTELDEMIGRMTNEERDAYNARIR